jgi:hypothetical protein
MLKMLLHLQNYFDGNLVVQQWMREHPLLTFIFLILH